MIPVYPAAAVREWDAFTILHEPVSALDLMERAATRLTQTLTTDFPDRNDFSVFCGTGNNGGDGLVMARLLYQSGKKVQVFILDTGKAGTADFQTNLQRLRDAGLENVQWIRNKASFPEQVPQHSIIVDALLGTGLNRPAEGILLELIQYLNQLPAMRIAVDLPSGLLADQQNDPSKIIQATFTYTFECLKPAQLIGAGAASCGNLKVVPIDLTASFLKESAPRLFLSEPADFCSLLKTRPQDSHKGTFGHALLIAGSAEMPGAALLSAEAVLRSGAGLLTVHAPEKVLQGLTIRLPEAIQQTDPSTECFSYFSGNLIRYNSVGMGPGLGQDPKTRSALLNLLPQIQTPVVLDADALNLLNQQLSGIPRGAVLTPHPKEFDRLFGESAHPLQRVYKALDLAQTHQWTIVLKGHHTLIACPNGTGYLNCSGNSGMATGGTGDVLTGLITGLLAQGYAPEIAARLGVFIHGRAADLALQEQSEESLIASDLHRKLGAAFREIASCKITPALSDGL